MTNFIYAWYGLKGYNFLGIKSKYYLFIGTKILSFFIGILKKILKNYILTLCYNFIYFTLTYPY